MMISLNGICPKWNFNIVEYDDTWIKNAKDLSLTEIVYHPARPSSHNNRIIILIDHAYHFAGKNEWYVQLFRRYRRYITGDNTTRCFSPCTHTVWWFLDVYSLSRKSIMSVIETKCAICIRTSILRRQGGHTPCWLDTLVSSISSWPNNGHNLPI